MPVSGDEIAELDGLGKKKIAPKMSNSIEWMEQFDERGQLAPANPTTSIPLFPD